METKLNFINTEIGEVRQIDLEHLRSYKDPIGKLKRLQTKMEHASFTTDDFSYAPVTSDEFIYEVSPEETYETFKDFVKRVKELL